MLRAAGGGRQGRRRQLLLVSARRGCPCGSPAGQWVNGNQNMSMTYRVAAAVQPGGLAHIDALEGRIPFDGSSASGDALPGPAHLLAAALAACMLKNVERMAGMLKFAYQGATVEVEAEREEPPPRIVRLHYRLQVRCEESAARLGLLHRNILKFGTITNTLSSCCKLNGQLVGIRADGTTVPADA